MSTYRMNQIREALRSIEGNHSVKILFAIESGSRVWGFESVNSDFDIRFVYLSRPWDYLTVFPRRDVLENSNINHPDKELDFSGWDIRKFLQLASSSNPAVFEWLQSSIIYRETDVWGDLRKIIAPFYSPRASGYHYLSMAKHNYREHMRDGAAEKVKLKKFLYIMRPLLCLRWIEACSISAPPPIKFEDLLFSPSTPDEVVGPLLELVKRKKAGEELNEEVTIPSLVSFIDLELTRWQIEGAMQMFPKVDGKREALDNFFYHLVSG